MNVLLYLSVVLLWGTTWLAIAIQNGCQISSITSIFYRFALASFILLLILVSSKRLRRISFRDHLFCILQGCCIFGLNFYCFYQATHYIASGLVSVMFSLAVLFNAFNSWIFFRQRPSFNLFPASLLGLIGMVLLFWQDIFAEQISFDLLKGLALSMLGVYSFSLGNMLSLRHQRQGLDIFSTNAYAMSYGTIIMGMIGLMLGVSFVPDWSVRYFGTLFYLAIFGSVIAFAAYFTLIGRIGAGKAAYSTLLATIVALILSTFFEGYQWRINGFVGLILILSGNVVMFSNPLKFFRKQSV